MARVAIYCASRSQIEAIVCWQNISFCLFILRIISKLISKDTKETVTQRGRSQISLAAFYSTSIDSIHSETAVFFIFLISSLIRFYYKHLKIMLKNGNIITLLEYLYVRFNTMFHMISKRALLVEVWCTLISLTFDLFQINFACLRGPKWALFRLKRSLGDPDHNSPRRRGKPL